MKKIITILSIFLIITLLFTGSCYARAGGGSGSGIVVEVLQVLEEIAITTIIMEEEDVPIL